MSKSSKKSSKNDGRKPFREVKNLAQLLNEKGKQIPLAKGSGDTEIPLHYKNGDLNLSEFGFLQVAGHNILGLVYDNIQESDAIGVSSSIKFDYDKSHDDRMSGFTITLRGILFYADENDDSEEEVLEIDDSVPPSDNEVF